MARSDAVQPEASQIAHDLPCAACGYNLRTLDRNGVCSECGRAVRDSLLPAAVGYPSFQAIRRTRAGIALWIAALALPALAKIIAVAIIRALPWYWQELAAHQSPYPQLYQFAFYAYLYAPTVAGLLQAAAIVLIVLPLGTPVARFKPRFAVVTAGLAVFAVVGSGAKLVFGWFAWTGLSWQSPWMPVCVITGASLTVSPLLGWIYMTMRLDARAARTLRRVMWCALLAPILAGSVVALDWAVWFSFLTRVTLNDPRWALYDISATLSKYVALPCVFLMLVVLWAYARKLNTALGRR